MDCFYRCYTIRLFFDNSVVSFVLFSECTKKQRDSGCQLVKRIVFTTI